MDSQQHIQQAFSIFASLESRILSMDTDERGNLFVIGFLQGSGSLFNTTKFSVIEPRLFTAKLNGHGKIMWQYIAPQFSIGHEIKFFRPIRAIYLFGCFVGSSMIIMNTTLYHRSADVSSCQEFQLKLFDHMTCEPCLPGFAAQGATQCEPCSSGTFSSNNASACEKCPRGTKSNTTACIPCEQNTYNPTDGGTCLPCEFGTDGEGNYVCDKRSLIFNGTNDTIRNIIIGVTVPVSALGLAVVVIAVGTCLACYVKRKRLLTDTELLQTLLGEELDESGFKLAVDIPVIPFENMTSMQELGSGGSGALVLKAYWEHKNVVIKLFRMTDSAKVEFQHEVNILAKLRDKNIIYFYGACVCANRIGIVTEYCPHGTLRNYIEQFKSKLEWNTKLRILLEAAQGLRYLHSVNLIHRDVKLDNILIDVDHHAKVADFGISKTNDSKMHTKYVGTSYYMAPEVTLSGLYSFKCDIFSFGIILFEVITENLEPFVNLANVELKIANDANFRPIIPTIFAEDINYYDYINLMRACWSASPDARPDAVELCKQLNDIMNSYK